MNIYYQGLEGLRGIPRPGRESVYSDADYVATGYDFELAGLSGIDENEALRNYLKRTRNVVNHNPLLIQHMYNPTEFVSMLDAAISAIGTPQEERVLAQLYRRENELIENGSLNLGFAGLSGYEMKGFFGELAGLKDFLNKAKAKISTAAQSVASKVKTTTQNVASKVKTAAQTVAAKTKETYLDVREKVNKVNPVTVAMRTGLRALLAVNFRGMSSGLMKNSSAMAKTKDLVERLGGDWSKFYSSIQNGAKRSPMFGTSGKIDVSGVEGLGALGEIVTISAALASAGALVVKIVDWLQEKGTAVVTKVQESKVVTAVKNLIAPNSSTQTTTDTTTTAVPAQTNIQNAVYDPNETVVPANVNQNDWKKYIPHIAVGVLVVGGAAYYLSTREKVKPGNTVSGVRLR